ncbi:hypothetical protein SAMN04488102_10856 [Alkalibacterium subtropicum]|uniref:Calcineurin-like phosphoesterase domain-containing protein n=1 Tax=Alkalibacterium subtropicum TaxID=753702 RepID=A0A1I1JLS5_9LACT|nr:metallophosphoesterase [Alkalibacterium subtropicum]SFC49537.1 hypothetical protein SAMN04488102_10856 [Alkalibacterium subtropicum]
MNKKAKRWLLAVGAVLLAIVMWGFVEPYILDVEEQEAVITNLPADMEGEKIAVIGDFQVGLWLDNVWTARQAVEDVIEMDPAAILITGDYLYHVESMDDPKLAEVMDIMRPLADSGIPVYSVLGNHDYAMSAEDAEPNMELAQGLADELRTLGVVMLDNRNEILLEGTDEDFYVVGLGSHWAGNDLPNEAFEGVPEEAPRMVLMHNPDSFAMLEAGAAPVAVAGHTHGGQIRTPFSSTWSYLSLFQGGEVTADGWIEDEYGAEENDLYVNRGIGMSITPMRINSVPEITVFTLTASD